MRVGEEHRLVLGGARLQCSGVERAHGVHAVDRVLPDEEFLPPGDVDASLLAHLAPRRVGRGFAGEQLAAERVDAAGLPRRARLVHQHHAAAVLGEEQGEHVDEVGHVREDAQTRVERVTTSTR